MLKQAVLVSYRQNRRASLGMFLGASLLLVALFAGLQFVNRGIELKKQILGVATSGFESLEEGTVNLLSSDLEGTRENLAASQSLFDEARSSLGLLSRFPILGDADKLLLGASKISSALQLLAQGMAEFENTRLVWDASTNSSSDEFYQQVKASRENFVRAGFELAEAATLLENVNPGILPEEFKIKYQEGLMQFSESGQILSRMVETQTLVLDLLAGESKDYLLIFQNNNEARATGGFIGTYGVVHFENGRVRIEKIESIYNLDGQLTEKIAAPGPLQLQASPYWGTRDSNWFVDFPMSARKILSFYEKITKDLPDGIISATPDVFERLLAISGPIVMPEYGETLTQENFREVVQRKTSLEYDRELNQPKKFLADFAPRLLKRLGELEHAQQLEIFDALARSAAEKQILMFSTDEETQGRITDLGLAGEIKRTDGDYLGIFHSNVGGGKTDQKIRQKVEKLVKINGSGRALTHVKITRTHGGYDEKFFPRNVDYMRILLPRGSRLLRVSGFDDVEIPPSAREGAATDPDLAFLDAAGQEASYTVFAGILTLDPGQTRTVELVYELPEMSANAYTLLLQKQPGVAAFDFKLAIIHPWQKITIKHPENFEGLVTSDKFYAIAGQ